MRDRKIATNASNLKIENTIMLTTITNIRKLVPQRGCKVDFLRAFSTVSSSPASQVCTTLCSAPWYWKILWMSRMKEIR